MPDMMQETPLFTDRNEAGQLLAKSLQKFHNDSPIIIALPRGGLPIGYEVAKALEAPLDILLVRKLGAPHNPELAIGAVVDGQNPELILNDETVKEFAVTEDYIEREKQKQLAEIERRRKLYYLRQSPLDLNGCTVILVDDGIATGSTMLAAVRALKRKKLKKLVVAAPVASKDSVEILSKEVDELICLSIPAFFFAVGEHYRDFPQLTDDDVMRILNR